MSYTKGQTIAIGVIFMILPTVCVGMRVWAKTLSRGGLGWDDYLIFLALVCFPNTTGVSCSTVLMKCLRQQP